MKFLRLSTLFLSLQLVTGGFAAQRFNSEWTFDRPRDLQGWQPNDQLVEVKVTNGIFSFRAAGSDPILEYQPLLDLRASPWQIVEIRLKADRDGTAELFWSNTSKGRYGGFAQDKTTRFSVQGDGEWHTYRVLPFWHREGRIVRLRFDVYDGAGFALDSIRIVELSAAPAARTSEFDFKRGRQGWRWFEPVSTGQEMPEPSVTRIPRCGTGMLLSPPVDINASENTFVSIRMTVDSGRHGTLFYATDASSGIQHHTFPLEADGREHTYNLDMLQASGWSGTVLALGLQPSNDTNAVASIARVKAGEDPEGPPRLRVLSFAMEEALPRVGVPARLTAIIGNNGGQPATNLVAEIQLPSGLKLHGGSQRQQGDSRLAFDEEKTFTWQVQAESPLQAPVRLGIRSGNAPPETAEAVASFGPRLRVSQTDYVPEPKPVRGPYEVGAYYFPGWKTDSQWQPLKRFPERKPVLGWYREGDPEVADWHIKWAVEHGLTFFAYDWYWSKGARHLEHALHDGYFKARYRHLLKFCLLWANHNPPRSSSFEDCLAVTRYWIENYFRRPEHLTFEGKPVVIIFAPDRLREDMGSQAVKRAFQAMRAECRTAGLQGLYLIACVGDAGGARRAAQEDYDAVTAYNWPSLGMPAGNSVFGPYATLVPAYRRHWDHIVQESRLPLVPVPVCGGWDSRPWHGENNLVRFGRTPPLFKQHLLDARRLLESAEHKPSTPKAILVEAWNEWGEGSYIEPHAEFGFGYLDALRETFTDAPAVHTDVTPADCGLGPYDVAPAEPAAIAWDFAAAEKAWDHTMQLTGLRVSDGVLSARTTGNDPAFFGPGMKAPAPDYTSVRVRMRLSRADGRSRKGEDSAQLFWRTSRLPESESTSVRFPVVIDEQWHDYRISVANNPRWRGTITRLRLDPVNQPDILVEIDRLWLGN